MINPTPARQHAIQAARQILSSHPVYADIETTGLGAFDEIIAISIIDEEGKILLETLVKPRQPIPPTATHIHGITDADVQSEPTWLVIWPTVRALLSGRLIVYYNDEFNLRMMQQSLARYNVAWKDKFDLVGLQKIYAQFHGEWDQDRRAYRYHSLARACADCGISLENPNRTTADTMLARALLHAIAGNSLDG